MIEATPSCFGGRFQGHSCQHSHQSSPGHPQVGQRKKRVKLLRVLGQVSGAHLHISKLGFIRNARSTLARILALLRASYWVNSSTSCSCPFHCACPCASRCANARRPWHRAATQRTGSRYHPRLRSPGRACETRESLHNGIARGAGGNIDVLAHDALLSCSGG